MIMNQSNSFTGVGRSSLAIVFAAALILSCVVSVSAQAPGSSRGPVGGDGGANMIQGRVQFPSGQGNSDPLKVTLESVNAFGGTSTSTDQDGVFRFTNVQAGNYAVVVDGGKQFETVREPVNIDRGAPGGRAIQVAIQLRYRIDSSNPAFAGIPQPALDAYQKGAAAAKKGDAKSAVEFLSKAISLQPNFPIALSDLGSQYMKLKQMDKAGETFAELVKLKPADSLAETNLGIALFNQKKLDEAETHLQQSVKLNSAGPTAHYYLGLTFISLKRYEEAQKEFELTITHGGDNLALAHKYLGGLYMSSKRNKEAADELEKYLKLDPKAADADRIRASIKDLRGGP